MLMLSIDTPSHVSHAAAARQAAMGYKSMMVMVMTSPCEYDCRHPCPLSSQMLQLSGNYRASCTSAGQPRVQIKV